MTAVRTFAQECIAIESLTEQGRGLMDPQHHMMLCLAGMVRSLYAVNMRTAVAVEIEAVSLDRYGYAGVGRYFGAGAKLFRVDVKCNEEWREYYVRAPDRKALRDALKRLFPNARVAR